jgi:membrane protein DedA with SNARE-associated domain/membrane-associated phospholipid phosphatase
MEPDAKAGGLLSWLREHWQQVAIGAAVLVVLAALNRFLPSIDVESALHDISNTLGAFAYALAAAAAFLETGAFVGLVLPGETFVILAGAVAGQGATSIWVTIAVVWLGAFAGDSTSFMIGRRLGREFALHHGARFGITHERLATVDRYFERYGGRTVVIGRFIGLVRALAPFTAGTSGMRYRHYVPYGLTGTGLWAAAFCLLGYFLSEHVNEAVHIAGRAGFWLGVAAAVVVGAILGVRYLRRAGEGEVLRAGLAATAVAAACGIAATIALALVVGSHSGPTGIDSSAFDAARDVRATWLTDVAKVVTYLGSVVVTLPVALVAAVVLAVRRRWWELAVLAIAVGVLQLAVGELKDAVDRPRPAAPFVGTSDSAFPSGHAAQAVIYLWLALLVALRARAAAAAALAGLGVLVVLVIGLTRVYLRAHFFTDVLGGWALGLAAFAIPTGVAIFLAIARVGNNQGDAAR